ncbi:MAG: hypothetical protein IPI67_17750 [Myxococcales bacterium]|nr:hypothetical protein [Myxococcales bacterium]
MASRRREGSRTKTAVPGLGSRFVAVRRLSTRLSNSDARLVTLVGPAGSGKTTLVASYVLAEKRPTLWYQLDAHDADASAFFNELTHAARRRCFGAETVLPAFDALLEPEVFASRLARAIAQALPERGLVVFDCGERAPDDSLVWVVARARIGVAARLQSAGLQPNAGSTHSGADDGCGALRRGERGRPRSQTRRGARGRRR